MRSIDQSLLIVDLAVLLTTDEIVKDNPMQFADFKDTHAVFYNPARRFLGLNHFGNITLGKTPLMINGIWYINPDKKVNLAYKNHTPDISKMELVLIDK